MLSTSDSRVDDRHLGESAMAEALLVPASRAGVTRGEGDTDGTGELVADIEGWPPANEGEADTRFVITGRLSLP